MRKTAKLIIGLVAAMLALSSCGPQAFLVSPEMRGPSKSGLNLAGKSIAVVYLVNNSARDTSFSSCLATGFASHLEEDYFGGEQTIELFTLPLIKGADYSSKDSLVNLVMDTGKDVVFLFDTPEFGTPVAENPKKLVGSSLPKDSAYVSTVSVPFVTKLYVYDSMNKNDKVLGFSGNKEMKPSVYCAEGTGKDALESAVWNSIANSATVAGYQAANSFLSTWQQEHFYVVYYDPGESAWDKASTYAYRYKWKEAILEWYKLLDTVCGEKKACACYNIGLACFMLGQPALALEWLDRSDAETPISITKELRNKIKEYSSR
jgi:hypothetical protein